MSTAKEKVEEILHKLPTGKISSMMEGQEIDWDIEELTELEENFSITIDDGTCQMQAE